MKKRLGIMGFATLFLLGQWGRAELALTPETLTNLCSRMLTTPFDRSGMAELSNFSISPSGNRQLRSLAMSVYALSALATQETNAYLRAKNRHATDFPEQKHMIRFDIKDCYSPCGECDGRGFAEKAVSCSVCGGKGKCSYKDCANGHWVITAPGPGGHKKTASALPCPVCKGSARCARCDGVQAVQSTCENCAGNRLLFKCPRALHQNYESLLREMLSLLNADLEFESRFQVMRAETNLQTRVRLCNALMRGTRSDARLCAVQESLREAERIIQEREADSALKNDHRKNEIGVLRGLAQTAPESSIRQIQEYLDKHRTELTDTDILALNVMKDDCVARVEHNEKRKKILYVAGGLLAVLLALSCVNVHFYRYTLLPSYSGTGAPARRPRGVLTPKENRGRVKSNTTEIVPLDE